MPENITSPFISVITPTYNRSALLREAIQSVLDQTYPNFELIVVDDGSTDDTAEVVASFKDKRIRYFHQKNQGVNEARNFGFSQSHGSYVSFLDSDDIMLPTNLASLVNLVKKDPSIDVAYGWQYLADSEGQAVGRPWGFSPQGDVLQTLLMEDTMMMGDAIIRRECVDAIGGFEDLHKFQEHWYFYVRLAQAGHLFSSTYEPVLLCRLHKQARSMDARAMLSDRLAILGELEEARPGDPHWESVFRKARYKAYVDFGADSTAKGFDDIGLECIQSAAETGPLTDNDTWRLISEVKSLFLLDYPPPGITPDVLIGRMRKYYAELRPTSENPRLFQSFQARYFTELAYWAQKRGERLQSLKAALLAMRYNPTLMRNKGLLRVAIEDVIGPGLFDWLKLRRYPLAPALVENLSKRPVIFISPHFDDVVLSSGGLLAGLARQKADVTLVTVFTADAPRELLNRPLVKKLHAEWGVGNMPFAIRQQEDQRTVDVLGIKAQRLGFLDVIYRDTAVHASEDIVPPLYDPTQDTYFTAVRDSLRDLIRSNPQAAFIAPLGLGHHRDHLVVFQALEEIKQEIAEELIFLYYEDYPYADYNDYNGRLKEILWDAKAVSLDISDTLEERITLVMMHRSQLDSLFGEASLAPDRIRQYAGRVGFGKKPCERYWYEVKNHHWVVAKGKG